LTERNLSIVLSALFLFTITAKRANNVDDNSMIHCKRF